MGGCEDGRINKKVFPSKRFIELHPRFVFCHFRYTYTLHIEFYLENATDWLPTNGKLSCNRPTKASIVHRMPSCMNEWTEPHQYKPNQRPIIIEKWARCQRCSENGLIRSFFSLPSSRSAIHSHKLRENQQQQKNMIIVAVAVVIIPYFIFIYSLIRFGAVDLDSVLSTFASQILFDVAINRCKQ